MEDNRRSKKRKQAPLSTEEQARISERARERKAEKKAEHKRLYEARLEKERAEREAKKRLEKAQPIYPIKEFCLSIGELPWANAENNWELGDRDLSIVVPPPNDILESVNEVPLRRGFTYRDLADAVTEAAYQEGAGGNICNVTSAELSQESATKLIVDFDIYAHG
jgi:hypothetical protein